MAWPAIIDAGTRLLSGGLNFIGQRRRQREEFKQNQAMARLAHSQDLDMWNRQNEHNLKMWHLQNEYNLPANQMDRLRAAGLNPNLIAGQGAAGGQATAIQKADTPKYQAPRARFNYTPLRAPDILGMYQNFELRQAQIDNVRAQEDLTKEKALTEAQLRNPKYNKAMSEDTIKYIQAKYSDYFAQLEVDQKKEILAKTKAERGLKDYEMQWMRDFGIRPQDPLAYRLLMRLMENFSIK